MEPSKIASVVDFLVELGKIYTAPKQDALNEEQSKEAAFKIINKSVEVCLVLSKYLYLIPIPISYIFNYHRRFAFVRLKNVKSRFDECWIEHWRRNLIESKPWMLLKHL